jgi:hypothetical protein
VWLKERAHQEEGKIMESITFLKGKEKKRITERIELVAV